MDRYARDSETFENSEVIVGWMAIKRSGNKTATEIKVTRPSFFGGYHPTLKLSGIPTFSFIVSLTHRMDNI